MTNDHQRGIKFVCAVSLPIRAPRRRPLSRGRCIQRAQPPNCSWQLCSSRATVGYRFFDCGGGGGNGDGDGGSEDLRVSTSTKCFDDDLMMAVFHANGKWSPKTNRRNKRTENKLVVFLSFLFVSTAQHSGDQWGNLVLAALRRVSYSLARMDGRTDGRTDGRSATFKSIIGNFFFIGIALVRFYILWSSVVDGDVAAYVNRFEFRCHFRCCGCCIAA